MMCSGYSILVWGGYQHTSISTCHSPSLPSEMRLDIDACINVKKFHLFLVSLDFSLKLVFILTKCFPTFSEVIMN